MARLLAKIKEAVAAKKFTSEPIGPIGYYLSVKNDKLAYAVEKALKKSMNSFIVTNSRDAHTLMQISKELNCFVDIITDPFKSQIYDTSKEVIQLFFDSRENF